MTASLTSSQEQALLSLHENKGRRFEVGAGGPTPFGQSMVDIGLVTITKIPRQEWTTFAVRLTDSGRAAAKKLVEMGIPA